MLEVLKFQYNGIMYCTIVGAKYLKDTFGAVNAVPISELQSKKSYISAIRGLCKRDLRDIEEVTITEVQESNGIFEFLGNVGACEIHVGKDFIIVDDIYVMADDSSVIGKSFMDAYPKAPDKDEDTVAEDFSADEEFPAYSAAKADEEFPAYITEEDSTGLALSETGEDSTEQDTSIKELPFDESAVKEMEEVIEYPPIEEPIKEELQPIEESAEELVDETEEIPIEESIGESSVDEVPVEETVVEEIKVVDVSEEVDSRTIGESAPVETATKPDWQHSVVLNKQPLSTKGKRHINPFSIKKKDKPVLGCKLGGMSAPKTETFVIGNTATARGCYFGAVEQEKVSTPLPTLISKETMEAARRLEKQVQSQKANATPVEQHASRVTVTPINKTEQTQVEIKPTVHPAPKVSTVEPNVSPPQEPITAAEHSSDVQSMLDTVVNDVQSINRNQRPDFGKKPEPRSRPNFKTQDETVSRSRECPEQAALPTQPQPPNKVPLEEFLAGIEPEIADFLPQIPKPLLLSITSFTSTFIDVNALRASGFRYCIDNRWSADGNMFAIDVPRHKSRYFFNKLTGVDIEIPLEVYKKYLQYV